MKGRRERRRRIFLATCQCGRDHCLSEDKDFLSFAGTDLGDKLVHGLSQLILVLLRMPVLLKNFDEYKKTGISFFVKSIKQKRCILAKRNKVLMT